MVKKVFYIVAWVLNSLCAIGLLISAYAYLIPPSRWLYAPVAAMSFPIWVIAMFVLLVLDIIFWRKCAIQAGLAILICWSQIRATCPLNIPKGDISDSERARAFTIMTYNVYKFYDHDSVYTHFPPAEGDSRQMSYILEVEPDIVCIQELQEWGCNTRISQAQRDSVHAAYPYVYVSGAEFGLLSKFPVEPVNIDFPADDFPTGDISCWRANVHGRVINIFSVHLCSIHLSDTSKVAYQGIMNMHGLSSQSFGEIRHQVIPNIQRAAIIRAQQIDLLIDYVAKYGGENVIVCGDFNDVENSYAVRRLQSKAHLKQAWPSVGFGPMTTYNSYSMYFHIDHILYRGAMKARSIRLDRIKASDHYPQTATFLLNKK